MGGSPPGDGDAVGEREGLVAVAAQPSWYQSSGREGTVPRTKYSVVEDGVSVEGRSPEP